MSELVDKVENLITCSKNIVALTGAGISTESGIPDYRTPGKGLWEKMDMSVVSLDGFLDDPTRYYSYSKELYEIRSKAKPNEAHILLAKMEEKGLLSGIVTQNVDGLHILAGSKEVHELHGSLRLVVCLGCNSLTPMENAMKLVMDGQNPPVCEDCGGVLKPNAVFFGEALPRIPWEESVELVKNCDLLLTIGSSLQVSPANILPDLALKNRAKIIIINLMPTPYDSDAELVIREKIAEFSGILSKKLNF
ncbi:MAG: SIR2 family NAD-dependent protein deacylase [Thermodesulfobacteriota bacterium]